jgi:predicted TIM-barrel fold metal-dependent hydrolase
MNTFEYRDFDRRIWEEELEAFVPKVVYDMHVHLWSEAHRGQLSGPPTGLRLEIDYQDHLEWAGKLFPGREIHFLALATPIPGMDEEGHNRWLAEQMAGDPHSAASMVVTPETTPEQVAAQVDEHGFFGMKPYRTFAPDMTNARIGDFLPEALIEVADEKGMAITLHLARKEGPADRENLADLQRLTRRYPRVQWILAHCARGFNSWFLERGIEVLRELPNIWYDSAAVNDLYSHCLLLEREDRKRVMFGSDDVVAGCARGKYITYGRAWQFYSGQEELEHCDPTPTLVVYEQLRQERQAAQMLELTPAEIEDHFAGNARRLIALVRSLRG